MDLLGNIFGEVRSGPTVPGADVTKPLTIALLQLLASRYLSGGQKAPDEDAEDEFSPDAADEISPSAVTSGLRGLIKHCNDAGLADHVQCVSIAAGRPKNAARASRLEHRSRKTAHSRGRRVQDCNATQTSDSSRCATLAANANVTC